MIVVGGGNSAAQLLAEVSTVAATTWVTPRPPRFSAGRRRRAGCCSTSSGARSAALAASRRDRRVGDIVMIPAAKDARARGVLTARPLFRSVTLDGVAWADGSLQPSSGAPGSVPLWGHLALLRTSGRVAIEA